MSFDSQRQCSISCFCGGEILVIRPHLLGESAQGIYYLTSGKLKGRRKCWRLRMKKEENEVDEKVKEVRENAQLMHATW